VFYTLMTDRGRPKLRRTVSMRTADRAWFPLYILFLMLPIYWLVA
jgi:hypothetical protein